MQNRLVVVLMLVGIAFGVAAFLGPWWVITTGPTSGPPNFIIGYGPFGSSMIPSSPSTSVYQDISEVNTGAIPAFTLVFLGGVGLLTVGLLSAVAMVTLAVSPESSASRRKRTLNLGTLAFLLVLAAVLEVAALLPGAMGVRFSGSYTAPGFWGSQVTGPSPGLTTWGAGWAWYLAAAAAAIFFIGDALLYRARGRASPALPTA